MCSRQKEEKSFLCEVCAKSFSHHGPLQNHLLSHSLKHLCPDCPEKFNTKRKLDSHRKKHQEKKKKRFACPHCPAVLSTSSNLSRHKENLHNKIVTSNGSFLLLAEGTFSKTRKKQNPSRICTLCGMKIAHSKNLKRHIMSCKNIKLTKCHYCSFSSKFPSMCLISFSYSTPCWWRGGQGWRSNSGWSSVTVPGLHSTLLGAGEQNNQIIDGILPAGFSKNGPSSVCGVSAKISAATTRGLRRLHYPLSH